jgi:hypothetical protein
MSAVNIIAPASQRKLHHGVAPSVIDLLYRLLGCWHSDMSRPLTFDHVTYRTCLSCGARRQFDVGAWRMRGPYYFAPMGSAPSAT